MGSGEDRSTRRPDRRLLLVAAGTALALMVLIVITTARNTPILHSPDLRPQFHLRSGAEPPLSVPGHEPSDRAPRHPRSSLLGDIVLGLIAFSLIVGIGWLLVLLARSCIRQARRWLGLRTGDPLPDVDDAVLDAVAKATRRHQERLLEGAPSNAIVACWVDLEHAVARAGVEKQPSETSAELTVRVLDALDLDRSALRTLGALYREARFSMHPSGEQQRESALVALDALRRSLPLLARDRV